VKWAFYKFIKKQ